MSADSKNQTASPSAPVPTSLWEYLRSFGPGFVIVLTWIGAGDLVDMAVAGGNYGYSLMWVLVVAVAIRFLFVSLIARYQLCNQHGHGVLDGLALLHPWYAPLMLAAAVLMGHVLGSYMTVGIGTACRNLMGFGEIWQWALLGNAVALALVFQGGYARVETLFKVFLALLTVSFIGTAVWVGPNPAGILQGLYRWELPEQTNQFNPLLVGAAMIGAVGGSIMNLVYPYFLDAKGWRGRRYLRVQRYDFLLAVAVMIAIDLAIWTLGAELLHPEGLEVKDMDDLPQMLSKVLGNGGRVLFYVGIFSVVFTSLIGQALGLAYLGSHAHLRWQAGSNALDADYRGHWVYRWIVAWCVISPLVWTLPGMPDFVTLTLAGNAVQVVLLPVIAGGLWWITASAKYIGPEDRNRWWENLLMAALFVMAAYGGWNAVASIARALS